MELSQFISANTLSALQKVANAPSADIYAPSFDACTKNFFYRMAAYQSCVLDEKFWKRMERIYQNHENIIITFKKCKIDFVDVTESRIFAVHVGELLKRDFTLVYVGDGCFARQIDWENWRSTYSLLAGTRKVNDLPDYLSKADVHAIRIRLAREKAFSEAAACDRYKKLGKRGFNMSFDEMRALRRAEQIEKEIRGVEQEARAIYAVV